MLYGVDMSHHQNDQTFQNVLNDKVTDFIIIKATEGKTYTDPTFVERARMLDKSTKLYGFYHYARPENNVAKDEADNFIDKVGQYLGKALLALDWEGNALKCDTSWIRQFADRVKEIAGYYPLIYCSSSVTKKLAAYTDLKLWVAHYNVTEPKIYSWHNWTMWQSSSSPYDIDSFQGTKNTWAVLAGGKLYDEDKETELKRAIDEIKAVLSRHNL